MTRLPQAPVQQDLGDGLILRRSTPADAGKLAEFNSGIHAEGGFEKPDERIGMWVSDLLTRPHPTFGSDDFTIVEEVHSGRIVSSLNLISQTWSYEGIPFEVGRPELVGTLPEYRHRRLVGIQFDEVHRWSAARGQMVQAITGIPYYYKRFDYDMALELGGGRVGFSPLVPVLKPGEQEPFVVRPASLADIPFLDAVYRRSARRSAVHTPRAEALWRYEIAGKSERNVNRSEFRIITDRTGEPLGFLSHPWYNWTWGIPIFEYELKEGVSWLDVTPAVARYALATSQEYARRDSEPLEERVAVAFWHGSAHPVYEVWRDRLPRIRKPYAWYVRVPDLPAFLQHIAPALEQRLAESHICGYSGSLRLNLYRSGIRLNLDRGRLVAVERYAPQPADMGEIGLPDLTVLQLVFGYRSIDELNAAYADCYWDNDEARLLVSVLFPKKPSWVAGVV